MRVIFICLLSLWPAIGHAQDLRKVSCRFLCFEGTPPPPPLLNLVDKGPEVSCSIPSDTLSPVIICNTKGNFINFFSAEDRKPAASATLAPHVKAAILVFVPAAKTAGGLPWRVFVIEDSDKNFPDGGAFVANFHVQDIRFTIGKTKEQLHPGAFHGVARPEPRDAFNMVPVVFEFQQDKTWRTASESKLRFVPGLRYLIFAYVDPVSLRPRICSLQDIKPYIPKVAPKDAPKVAPR